MALLNFGGMFALVIVGFVATLLTDPEDASYKVGALAAAVLSLLYFIICLFTPPTLPYQLPSPMVLGVGYAAEGLFTLILGLVFGLVAYAALGALGGYIAEKLFKPERKEPPSKPKPSIRKKLKGKPKKKKRSLYKT